MTKSQKPKGCRKPQAQAFAGQYHKPPRGVIGRRAFLNLDRVVW